MSKNELKIILQKYGLRPNKLLGQNFLIDRSVLKKIIAAADLSKDDIVLEIGPGLGVLTEALAERAGQVIAVEKDKRMAEILEEKFSKSDNVQIIFGDILKILPLGLPLCKRGIKGDLEQNKILPASPAGGPNPLLPKKGNNRYKVVANIPYYLTSHLIRKFLESNNPPQEMILMIQKEVAQRICAAPPKMSLLAVSVQFYAQPKIVSYVSKNSFWPRPKVDSAIIRITPHSSPLCKKGVRGDLEQNKILPASPAGGPSPPFVKEGADKFFKVVRAGFAHPRKQLINNLSQGLKIDRAKISATLKKIGLSPEQRAETLDVADWTKLTDAFYPSFSGDVARRQNK